MVFSSQESCLGKARKAIFVSRHVCTALLGDNPSTPGSLVLPIRKLFPSLLLFTPLLPLVVSLPSAVESTICFLFILNHLRIQTKLWLPKLGDKSVVRSATASKSLTLRSLLLSVLPAWEVPNLLHPPYEFSSTPKQKQSFPSDWQARTFPSSVI